MLIFEVTEQRILLLSEINGTELVAALVRKRTAMPGRWVADRLGMGHKVAVTRAVRRFRDDRKSPERLNAHEKMLEP